MHLQRITEYFASGKFEKEVSDLSSMLLPYVEKDPTAFYTADEFRSACIVFAKFGMRRAESIRKQISGELASFSDEQDSQDKVDASDLPIIDMGAGVLKI